MEHKVLIFKETSSGVAGQIEKLLKEGWKIDRADALGKIIIYVFFKRTA